MEPWKHARALRTRTLTDQRRIRKLSPRRQLEQVPVESLGAHRWHRDHRAGALEIASSRIILCRTRALDDTTIAHRSPIKKKRAYPESWAHHQRDDAEVQAHRELATCEGHSLQRRDNRCTHRMSIEKKRGAGMDHATKKLAKARNTVSQTWKIWSLRDGAAGEQRAAHHRHH